MEVVIEDSQIHLFHMVFTWERFVLIKIPLPGPMFQNVPLDEKEEESLNPWMLSSHWPGQMCPLGRQKLPDD